jgi:hypothetical protein
MKEVRKVFVECLLPLSMWEVTCTCYHNTVAPDKHGSFDTHALVLIAMQIEPGLSRNLSECRLLGSQPWSIHFRVK